MKTIVLSLLLLFSLQSYSQNFYFKARATATRQFSQEWGEWYKSDASIIIDTANRKLFIISQEEHEFTLLDEISRGNNQTEVMLMLAAIDEEGKDCIIEIIHFLDKEAQHFYIRWLHDKEVVYQTIRL